MESTTLKGVSEKDIAEFTQRAFDMKPMEITEIKDGIFESVYKIRLSDGSYVILKTISDDVVTKLRRNPIQTELCALKKLSTLKYVPVPNVIFFDNSRNLTDGEYFFTTFMPGTPLYQIYDRLPVSDQSEIYSQIGVYAHKINTLQGKNFGQITDSTERFRTWSEVFFSMTDSLLCDAEQLDIHLPVDFDKIRKCVANESEILNCVKTPVFIHKNLWKGNIFVNAETVEVTGIVGFEHAIYGDALMEPIFGLLDNNENFVSSYTSGRGFDRISRLRMALYRIYNGIESSVQSALLYDMNSEMGMFSRIQLDKGISEYHDYKGE